MGLDIDGVHRAYRLILLGDAVVHDTLGEAPVIIFSQDEGIGGAAFSPHIDGRQLTFVLQGDRVEDQETRSIWELT